MEWSELTLALIRAARDEDLDQAGDLTAEIVRDPDASVVAHIAARKRGVIAGLALAPVIAAEFGVWLGTALSIRPLERAAGQPFVDGDCVSDCLSVAEIAGPRRAVLIVERTLLNFLCRLSGVATLTRAYVDAARRGHPAIKVLDTRKTLPGWRELDKYAVRCGGGMNHRFGLYDAVLIKDNHIAGIPLSRLAGEVFEMLNRISAKPSDARVAARTAAPAFVEVEVDSLEQMREVCKVAGVDMILLDNFDNERLREAVQLRDALGLRGRIELEASGGVTLETIESIAATGVDRISVGAITHSAAALDLGLDFVA